MRCCTEIETEVIDVIRRQLHASARQLGAWTRFVDDLGADSLAVVELTIVFEETFDIEIPDEEANRIRTVRDAIIAVEKYIRARFVDEPGEGTKGLISSAPTTERDTVRLPRSC